MRAFGPSAFGLTYHQGPGPYLVAVMHRLDEPAQELVGSGTTITAVCGTAPESVNLNPANQPANRCPACYPIQRPRRS